MYGWKNSLIRGLGFICYDNKSPVMQLEQLSENDWKSLQDDSSSNQLNGLEENDEQINAKPKQNILSPKNTSTRNGPQFENSPLNVSSNQK